MYPVLNTSMRFVCASAVKKSRVACFPQCWLVMKPSIVYQMG